MEYIIKNVDVRELRRINRKTGESTIVTVSNRNKLSYEEQIRLLNLNDEEFIYEKLNM